MLYVGVNGQVSHWSVMFRETHNRQLADTGSEHGGRRQDVYAAQWQTTQAPVGSHARAWLCRVEGDKLTPIAVTSEVNQRGSIVTRRCTRFFNKRGKVKERASLQRANKATRFTSDLVRLRLQHQVRIHDARKQEPQATYLSVSPSLSF